MRRHMKYECNSQPRFACYCGYVCSRKETLKRHAKAVHKDN